MLTKRQITLLEYIAKHNEVTREELQEYSRHTYIHSSKGSILRDINTLLEHDLICKHGKTKGITYSLAPAAYVHIPFDVEAYFSVDTDDRVLRYPNFSFAIFDEIISGDILNGEEQDEVMLLTEEYKKNKARLL